MNTLVLYQSKYGSTAQYAQWIGEALECPVDSISHIDRYTLENYDVIILGEGIYAGQLKSPKILKQIMDKYPTKRYIFFLVGLSDMEDTTNTKELYANLKKYIGDRIEQIKVYYLRGAIDYGRLSIKHKVMMWMLYRSLTRKSKEQLTKEECRMIETYGKQANCMNKAALHELLDYVNNPI